MTNDRSNWLTGIFFSANIPIRMTFDVTWILVERVEVLIYPLVYAADRFLPG
jgi:hypothetical protein